jgi:hypothetical protein
MQEPHAGSSLGVGGDTLARLRAFCLPGGVAAARRIRRIRTNQRGAMRMSPKGRWMPFTAEETTDTTRSNFCWDARFDAGKLFSLVVKDAYEEGHGRLSVKAGGVLPLMKSSGPDADKAELQRYLSALSFCPAILVNHTSLFAEAVDASTVRLGDRNDPTGAVLDLVVSQQGEPIGCHADRPRLVGKKTIVTSWSGTCSGFCQWEGLRVATRLAVGWNLPDGLFEYYRSEITSFVVEA